MIKYFQFIYLPAAFALVLLSAGAQAQSDSIGKPQKIEKKWKYDSQVDTRNSFITGPSNSSSNLSIVGYNFGWLYKNHFRIGMGLYYARSQGSKAYFIKYDPVIQNYSPGAVILYGAHGMSYLVQKKVQMFYFTPSFEWIFFSSKWLELGIPVEVGIGYSKLSISDYFSGADIPVFSYKTGKILGNETIFFPALSGLDAMINLTPDISFQAGFGYRYILQESGISQNYNGWFYMLGFQLLPENVIKDMKKDWHAWKEKKRKKKELKRLKREKGMNN